jgi:phage gp37-like protein
LRYSIANIEDQIIDTLKTDTTYLSGVNSIQTYAGEVNLRTFLDAEEMQGFIRLLPFILVSYQGRTSTKSDRDSRGKLYIHTLTFRLFIGAKSLRVTRDASRSAYDILAAVYDDLHGKVPKSTIQGIPNNTALSGTTITTSEFNPLSPLLEAGGTDERLVVITPEIVVYSTDYNLKLLA